jgi:hypothetical protein
MERFTWDGIEVQPLKHNTTKKLPFFSDDIPNDLVGVVDAIRQRVGDSARVSYLGHFARHTVTKMILVTVTRALEYRIILRALSDGSYQTEGLLKSVISTLTTTLLLMLTESVRLSLGLIQAQLKGRAKDISCVC